MPLAHTGSEGTKPTFHDLAVPIRGSLSSRSKPELADGNSRDYYDEALAAGSLLLDQGTRLPSQHLADTDFARTPYGHDVCFDLDPVDTAGTSSRVESAIRNHRRENPFVPVIVEG